MSKIIPEQKPGKSKQDYGTPRWLINAVEKRFGSIAIDLAAESHNAKAKSFIGPEEDSLIQQWTSLLNGELGWLNPPFSNIRPWAKKCEDERLLGARIAFLVPASIGSNWFYDHVFGKSLVLALPRFAFEGETQVYPKDIILCVYDLGVPAGFDVWRIFK